MRFKIFITLFYSLFYIHLIRSDRGGGGSVDEGKQWFFNIVKIRLIKRSIFINIFFINLLGRSVTPVNLN